MDASAKIPPGPKINPFEFVRDIVAGEARLITDPLAFFRPLHEQFGDIVFSDFGISRFYFTDNTDLLRKVFIAEPRAYKKAEAYKEAALFLGNGILNSEGDVWQAQRGMVQPAFSKSRLAAFAASMAETSATAVTNMPRTTDVSQLAMHIALENICKFLFGRDFAVHEKVIREAVQFGNNFISKRVQMPIKFSVFLPSLKNLRFFYHRLQLDHILYKIIDQRLKDGLGKSGDLLDMLLTAEREHSKGKIRREQVRDELLTLLIAGHETTGFTLAMALWLIATHAGVQDELRREIAEKLPDDDSVDAGALENCAFLDAVVSETLRLYPAAWIIGRRIVTDEIFNGYLLKSGSELQCCILALHRNAKYWSDPDTFKPERFLGNQVEPVVKLAYMPFGAGPRRCIGNVFALLEMKIAIVQILRRYNLKPTPGAHPSIEYLFTARLKNPLPLDFEPIT